MTLPVVKIGVVGLGNIGQLHLKYVSEMANVELVGVCDVDQERANRYAEMYNAKAYPSPSELLAHSGLDVVIIAVPHYDHPAIAIEAFERGIHVMCEKPIAVHVNDANRMIQAYEAAKLNHPGLQFAIMFQERTLPFYAKLKEIVASGELGQLTRATWIHTKWFRSQAYYNSGGWRATWAGEGGGILTNQCPHTLDMYQWLFGLPSLISGHAHIGKYHDIEVEDEVTAYLEHANGMVGHLIVTTAELPGTNRLEIVGDLGKLILENGKLLHFKYPQPLLAFSRETDQHFATWTLEPEEVDVDTTIPTGHEVVTRRLVDRLLGQDVELIAEGPEGLGAVTLANGIMLSSFEKRPVAVPIDGDAYQAHLEEKIQTSTFVKQVLTAPVVVSDMSASFGSNNG
ncbi:Gfo/Idh/MocA family oxidoreductase [Paenibacillus oryzisoli]|uniref:Gfo/Idh/MocA family protein n=1 Tax=Paenibacillus oryzisoli TaxID=1850517 RepID=UPI003D2BF56E